MTPNKEFSFARAYEHIKGWIQGVVKLSNQKEMLCVARDGIIKLIGLNPNQHGLQQQIGKETSILLDKEACIYQCKITEHQQDREHQVTVVNQGKSVAQREIVKGQSKAQEQNQIKVQSERQLISHTEKDFHDGIGL